MQYLGRQTTQRKAKTKDPCLAICTTLKFVQIVVSVTRAAVSSNNQKICAICSLVSCNRHHRDINLWLWKAIANNKSFKLPHNNNRRVLLRPHERKIVLNK